VALISGTHAVAVIGEEQQAELHSFCIRDLGTDRLYSIFQENNN
jgi:hypothetical protein